MKKFIFLLFFVFILQGINAQKLSPILGVGDERPEVFAFTNATIVVDYQTVLKEATLVIKKGKIAAIGKDIQIPENAVTEDLDGKFIYPSFIDLYSSYGIETKTIQRERSRFSTPQFVSKVDGPYYWNDAIKPYLNAVDRFHVNNTTAEKLRNAGFGAVVTQNSDGIMRGTSALVVLKNSDEEEAVLKGKVATGYSLDKGSSEMNYPGSLMGAVALFRQTLYDADWYSKREDQTIFDESLEAINKIKNLPAIFDAGDKLQLLKMAEISKEFNLSFITKGNGDEYQLIEEIAKTNTSIIIPVNFPEAPDVADPFESILVPFEDLKHWEMAPSNPAELAKANIEFAFTAEGLKDVKTFRTNILKAVKYGLSKENALKALTKSPAELIGCDSILGSIEVGKTANFLVTSTDWFDKDCIVYENWIRGEKYVLKEKDLTDLAGKYTLILSNKKKYDVEITGKTGAYSISVKVDKKEIKGKISATDNLVSISFGDKNNWTRLSGWKTDTEMEGTGILASGNSVSWQMSFDKKGKDKNLKKEEDVKVPELGKVIYPFVAYGNEIQPESKNVLIKNATVWTLENEGTLENTDVLVKDGKIAAIGKGLNADGATEIDGTGLHLSPGIIDEHSHIGLNGTNEATHAVTSEVRMKDVLNPEDVSFYRQLSGGVTCAQLLHGSANPIGGQSIIVKFRWGATPENMEVENQVGFLKHALGENVKQSRLPSFLASRFPQSRMGVEQSIRDAYLRAVEYKNEWEKYDGQGVAPRKNLQLDAIVDVLNKKSFMGIHTYVQSETNMIIKLAQEFGVKPHTLIHNTEGYKVADQMKESGAAGSLFADWWAFKYEVYDAIPYNAAILTKHDVLSCIHSDDPELARRLNQEAGKAVKYGGLSEEQALKLVTLNPAKILHLDKRMGSIKVGKDADLVLWTDHPLSIYAKAAKTFVDGTIYYDMEKDKVKYQEIQKERARIINKILAEGGSKKSGSTATKPAVRVNEQYIYGDEDFTDYTKNNFKD